MKKLQLKSYLKYLWEFYTWVCTAIVSGFLLSFILSGGDISLGGCHLRYDGVISLFF